MEGGSLVAETLLAGAESSEVLGGSGNDIGAKFHDNFTGGSTTDGHIEENSWKGHSEGKKG